MVNQEKPYPCDGCDKERGDVRSVGRDYNGDPDAPSLCFVCRKEWEERRRVYDKREKGYVRFNEEA
jgi:hypothetical protein